MSTQHGISNRFYSGVIEGFYGQPWSRAERADLFRWMEQWGMNTYFYGPKDDLKHRACWRDDYDQTELRSISEIVQRCREHGIDFIYALSPGLDICYSNDSDVNHIKRRLDTVAKLGVRYVCLLFDDIPDQMHQEDQKRWGCLASAQATLTNQVFEWLSINYHEMGMMFCPTPYCGRMAANQHGGVDYLETLGRELREEVLVFWTGPEIISREITVEHIRTVALKLRRKPLVWDNLHANDYDGARFYTGPYAGRPAELKVEVSGILANPNSEFPLNFAPLHSFADFLRSESDWDPRESFLAAMRAWLPRFYGARGGIELDRLIELMDCYYLPYEEGASAMNFYTQVETFLLSPAKSWKECEVTQIRSQIQSLKETCARIAELDDRPLFYALSRRVWALREELDLIDCFIRTRAGSKGSSLPVVSDFHLPGTCRGGMVQRLQGLLGMNREGKWENRIRSELQHESI